MAPCAKIAEAYGRSPPPLIFILFLVVLISITKLCDGEAVGHHTPPPQTSPPSSSCWVQVEDMGYT